LKKTRRKAEFSSRTQSQKTQHEANERGIPLYTVTKDNIKDVLEILEVGQAVKNGYNEFCK